MVILTGVALMSTGLLLAPLVLLPWHLYATVAWLLVVARNKMTYTAYSQFLVVPTWYADLKG
jgi:hypothetical protein